MSKTYSTFTGRDCLVSIDGMVIDEVSKVEWNFCYDKSKKSALKLYFDIFDGSINHSCLWSILQICVVPETSNYGCYLWTKLGSELSSSCLIDRNSKEVITQVNQYEMKLDMVSQHPDKRLIALANDNNCFLRAVHYLKDKDPTICRNLLRKETVSFYKVCWLDYIIAKLDNVTVEDVIKETIS